MKYAKQIIRALAFTVALMLSMQTIMYAASFKDVPKDAYYAEAVQWAQAKGITSGTDEKHFEPDLTCTRGQAVTFLWRVVGMPMTKLNKNPFVDVQKGSFYYKAVLWAYEKEVTAGNTPTHFSPNEPCTRGHVVTFLWRTAGKPFVEGSSRFVDVVKNAYYYDAVNWAVKSGVTGGVGNNRFASDEPCTRAQIVTFLYRYYMSNHEHTYRSVVKKPERGYTEHICTVCGDSFRDNYVDQETVTEENCVHYTAQDLTEEQKEQARENIGAADVALIDRMREQQPNLFVEEYQTGNLLDNTKMVPGGYISLSGEVKPLAAASYCEEYIDLSHSQGTHLAMYAYHSALGAYRCYYRMCFYDANKVKTHYTEYGADSADMSRAYVEIPEGAVYARVSFITKGEHYTYIVVRGNAEMALDYYEYTPYISTTVPADLNEQLGKIDELYDAVAEMTENKNLSEEMTVTNLNNSNYFSQNDITFVGDELWMSKENSIYYENGTMIFRYKIIDGKLRLVGTCDCDFGHLNTMDYDPINDCLIFGNGGNDTKTEGNYFVVVKDPRSLGSTALMEDVGIRYEVDVGYKVQALWGESNLGAHNIVYLLSNHSSKITKLLLLKGDDGQFNGSYVILESHKLDTWGVQGADIFGDVLYIGGQEGGNEYAAIKEISLSDFSTVRIVKQKFYADDGTPISGCVQGVYVDKNSVWISVNTGDESKPVCLSRYSR